LPGLAAADGRLARGADEGRSAASGTAIYLDWYRIVFW